MIRAIYLCLAFALVAAFASAGYERWKTGSMMADTANHFLASLTPDQKAKTTFAYTDEERKNWWFVPRIRKGITFKEMLPEQQRLAHAFLSSGLSRRGYIQATTIMSLDAVLREIEKGMQNTPVRDSELYYVSVFGDPSALGRWGWRIEGHHLSVNFAVDRGEVKATTPQFFGANPAQVLDGPRKGLRTLPEEEDFGRELLMSLDDKQQTRAVILKEAPTDIITSNKRKAEIGEPTGLPYTAMTPKQREILIRLVDVYITRNPEDVAEARRKELQTAGWDKVFFAWAGGSKPREKHYYRVQGPTFLIEYDNTQNDANHIHSVWRDLRGDFGPDLLAEHYRQFPHGGIGTTDTHR